MPELTTLHRGRRAVAAIAFAGALLACAPAGAQQLVARVNGVPITAVDIAQRTRLIEISTHKKPSRQEVLDELIDEKLKLQVAARYKLDITEKEVTTAFNNVASRVHLSPAQFAEALKKSGISVDAVKMRLKAEMAWGRIVRGKYQADLQLRDKDVTAAAEARNKGAPGQAYDYTLRSILFIVPRGSPQSVLAEQHRQAEALRARFTSCEEGVPFARRLKDVAVRRPTTRSSADFPEGVRAILEKTEVGHLTPPEVTQQGVELFAVCGKRKSVGDTPGEREAREQLMQERFKATGERFIKELRRSAMIEYR